MKKFFRTIFTVALCVVVFCLGSILGGDKMGIGKGIGLGKGDGNLTKEDVSNFIDATGDKLNDVKDQASEIISQQLTPGAKATATPTPHPYTTVQEITITVGRGEYSFFGEPCSTPEELSNKISEAHTLNPSVKFIVDYSIANDKTTKEAKKVIEAQEKANGIKFTVIE